MFPIRRAALRLLASPSVSFASRSRTITSSTIFPLRLQKQTLPATFQKRWASDETKHDDAPISKLQPTPQEEVENAIHEDNAAHTVDSATVTPEEAAHAESSGITENASPSRGATEAVSQESHVDTSQESVGRAVSAGRPREDSGSQTARHKGPMDPQTVTPKPTIYIGNLFFDVTEDDLTKELARFGKVERVRVVRDARGLSKGFGYVTFSSTEEATSAIDGMNQQLFEGRRVTVYYAVTDIATTTRKRPERALNPPSQTLFIGNLSWEMTDKDLNQLFRPIKNVIDVRVAIDRRTGQPRGFAHADFSDVKSAMEAFKLLDGQETYGRRLRLDYSYGASQAPRNQAKNRGDL